MPKAGVTPPPAPKKTTKKKVAAKKKGDPVDDDPAMIWSDDDDEQQEAIIIMGEIGSGKTYCAATASAYWPRTLPAKRLTVLEDMFWFQTDRKATAGLKADKIKVATFDVFRFMHNPRAYRECGFEAPPSWFDAVEVGVERALEFCERCYARGIRPRICVDTITGFDTEQFRWAKDEAQRIEDEGAKHNQYRAFAIHGDWHTTFFSDIIACGADVIFCAHQRAQMSGSPGAKDKAVTVRVAGFGDAQFVPDFIGNIAPKLYKRHTSLQVIMKAWPHREGGKQRMKREILIGINNEGGEAKNRYERALERLDGRMSPPNLGKILKMIRE